MCGSGAWARTGGEDVGFDDVGGADWTEEARDFGTGVKAVHVMGHAGGAAMSVALYLCYLLTVATAVVCSPVR